MERDLQKNFKLLSKKKDKEHRNLSFSSFDNKSDFSKKSDQSIIITDTESENSSINSENISLLSFGDLKQKLIKEKNFENEKNLNQKIIKEKIFQNENDLNQKIIKEKNFENENFGNEKKLEEKQNENYKENINKNYNKKIADLYLRKFLSKMKKNMLVLGEEDFCFEIEYFLDKYSILVEKKIGVDDIILMLKNKLMI